MTLDRVAELDRLIASILDERELSYEHPQSGAFFVSLPGTHKLVTNARMYGVAFCADALGDVYLVGRTSLDAVTAPELDRLLGCVLSYSDDSFDTLLELGFAESIRREWRWRVSRGESLANLQAFARFADPARTAGTAE